MFANFIVIGWTLLIAYWFFSGIMNMTADDPPSDGVFAAALFASMVFHFTLWIMVAAPTYLISKMVHRSRKAASA